MNMILLRSYAKNSLFSRKSRNSKKIGLNAYRTVRDVQNAKVAAERFIHVLDAMLNKKEIPQYSQGPMRKMG